jgi:hypothetical protein
VLASDQSALVVGRDDALHIEGENTLCVDKVEEERSGASPLALNWKSPKANALEMTVPLKDAAPGAVTLNIRQFGLANPDQVTLIAYSEAASLDRLTLSSGDKEATLTGTRLDEVAGASLDGVAWAPSELKRVQDIDRLEMKAANPTNGLEPGKRYTAKVQLRDGRELKVAVTVEATRPRVTLLSKGTQDGASAEPSPVQLSSADDLPVERRLVFFLKSKTPESFPRDEKVEVAAVDGSFKTVLSVSDGTLMLEDANTALGVVEPLARFGSSAFGPLQTRALSADGVPGDWLPLGTLVRLPGFKELRCPHLMTKPCTLTGTNLFLASSIAAVPEFENSTDVPPDFTGTQLTVPHPVNGLLYLKLRDDPATVQTLALTVTPLPSGSSTLGGLKPFAPSSTAGSLEEPVPAASAQQEHSTN